MTIIPGDILSPCATIVLIAIACAAEAQPTAIGADDALQAYQLQLNELESRNGQGSVQLLETLEAMADRLIQAEAFAEAHATLDRAQQILRVNEGLYTPAQYPLLFKKIENHIRAGDWEDARQLQDHLFWLLTNKHPTVDEQLIADLLRASDLHARGAVSDATEYRNHHYRLAEAHNQFALAAADVIWPALEPRRSALLYRQLKHAYSQTLAMEKPDASGRTLRTDGIDQRFMLDEEVALSIHRGKGYRYLQKLRKFYLQRPAPDREALAMTVLYTADWQLLYRQRNLALASYARAYAELLEAGVPAAQVTELFAAPTLIPEAEFYPTVAAALRGHSEPQFALPDLYDGPVHFRHDTPADAPDVAEHSGANTLPYQELARFSLRLAGPEQTEPGLWSRQPARLSIPREARIIDSLLTSEQEQAVLVENLQWFRFRPRLVNGIPAETTGLFSYLLAREWPSE